MSRRHLLPTATVDDVMSWKPCSSWPRKVVEQNFQRAGKDRVNALDLLEAKSGAASGDLLWAACHLLPLAFRPSFNLRDGCREPDCCVDGRGHSYHAAIAHFGLGSRGSLRDDLLRYVGEI